MAKLKAHGQELLRIERERDTCVSTLTTWERETRVYMSDGVILTKIDVRFRPDVIDPQGSYHSYGWKKFGRLKDELRADMSKYVEEKKQRIVNTGWVVR